MAKSSYAPKTEIETPVTLMRSVGPERFEVVSGVVRGVFIEKKQLEKSVSLAVGRGTARRSLTEQHRHSAAVLGLDVEI